LTDLKKYLLLILTAWLLIVSCQIYRYCSVDWYNYSDKEISRIYFEKNVIQEYNYYESRLPGLNLYKNVKCDLEFLVKADWIKTDLIKVLDVSYISFTSYALKIINNEIFKDFLMIYPFNFFF